LLAVRIAAALDNASLLGVTPRFAAIVSAMSSGNGDIAGAWEPYSYLLAEHANGVNFCDGKTTGTVVLAVLVARGDYAKQYPDRVARFLAVYLRATKWLEDNPARAEAELAKFVDQGGITLSTASLKALVQGNKIFNIDEQLAAMNRVTPTSNSKMDYWMDRMSEFMRSAGSIPSAPRAQTYVTDKYLQMIKSAPKLYSFSKGK
jgi:NitT/TauT family transport system substrate-binding protein